MEYRVFVVVKYKRVLANCGILILLFSFAGI